MAAVKMMIPFLMAVLFASYNAEAAIGMNWGRQTVQRLLPSQVVDLLLQNGIGSARIYTSQPDILDAFSGSGINLTVGIFQPEIFKTPNDAKGWIQRIDHYIGPSSIRHVYLGGSVFEAGKQDKAYLAKAWNALNWLQEGFEESQNGKDVKAHFLINSGVLTPNISKPSQAEFLPEIQQEMRDYINFLQQHNSPYTIDMFPIATCIVNNFDISFAFADNRSNLVITDINGAFYTNLFEWQYDCFVWAIEKLMNRSNIKIVVSQVGWPTDGIMGANSANAERYYKYLLPLVASNKGTPKRPGAPIDVYLHSLTDENRMLNQKPYTRHWGIYRSNGQPKFKVDLTGQGRDIFPTVMKGIMQMPRRWCIFNNDVRNLSRVREKLDWACRESDCTTAAPGGSCSGLTFKQNVSYAFNMYFQSQFQDEAACDLLEFGVVSSGDPSTETCLFPVEVVKGLQLNFAPVTPPSAQGFRRRPGGFGVLALMLLLLWNWM